jgi:hypothetical protein
VVKLLWVLALAILAFRLVAGRWPWQFRRLPGRGDGRRQARLLLGVGDAPSREDIIEAHRRLVVMVHPDRGGTSEQVHEANAARDTLLEELAARTDRP